MKLSNKSLEREKRLVTHHRGATLLKSFVQEIKFKISAISFCKIANLVILRFTCDVILSIESKISFLTGKAKTICTFLISLTQMGYLFYTGLGSWSSSLVSPAP